MSYNREVFLRGCHCNILQNEISCPLDGVAFAEYSKSTAVLWLVAEAKVNSVAILAEISYFARNLAKNSDEDFRSIGREILPKNARNFTLSQISPKMPEIWLKLA